MKWKGYRNIIFLLMFCFLVIIVCQNCRVENLNDTSCKEKVVQKKNSVKETEVDEQNIADSRKEKPGAEAGAESNVEQTATVSDEYSGQTTSNNFSSTTSTHKNASSNNQTESHTHTWVAQTQTVSHAEEGHYETKVIQEVYDEEVYGSRTFCNRCTDPITGLPLDITGSPGDHVISVCGGGYYAKRVVVDTIHHDAVTEQVWVVDKAAWVETITIGYECSCGALK